jgi:proline iminopeptidase
MVAVAAYQWLARPRMLSSGATPRELQATYPGDDLLPGGHRHSTMATTIAAPPRDVWPWLLQMGGNRAGFYSWDRLDNGGRASAERIHSEWQDLRQGDRIDSAPDGSTWFDVALLQPERALVLRASLTLPVPKNFDPAERTPRAFSDSTWAFFLTPTPEGHTRLVVTGAARGRPWWLVAVGSWLLWDPAHWVMQTKQLANLRRRSETPPGAAAATPPPNAKGRAVA